MSICGTKYCHINTSLAMSFYRYVPVIQSETKLTCVQKNRQLRTVVNKLSNIHAEFRYFDMEVIAGEDNEEVFVSTIVSVPMITDPMRIEVS